MYRCNRRLSDRCRRHYRLPALLNLPTASTSSAPGPPIGVVVVAPAIPLPSPLSRASAAPVARRSSPHPTILESREAAPAQSPAIAVQSILVQGPRLEGTTGGDFGGRRTELIGRGGGAAAGARVGGDVIKMMRRHIFDRGRFEIVRAACSISGDLTDAITIAPGWRVFQPRARRGKARRRLATGRLSWGSLSSAGYWKSSLWGGLSSVGPGELRFRPGDKCQNDASMGRWIKFLVKLNLL